MPGQNLVVRDVRISATVTRAQEATFKELAKRRNMSLQEWMRFVMDAEVSRQAAKTIRERHTPSVEGQMEALRQENRQIDGGLTILTIFAVRSTRKATYLNEQARLPGWAAILLRRQTSTGKSRLDRFSLAVETGIDLLRTFRRHDVCPLAPPARQNRNLQ